MSREIKFKCWLVGKKKMLILESTTEAHNHYLQTGSGGFWLYESTGGALMANSEAGDILLQFIGLKDRKDQEIFEGDILTGWKKGSNSDRGYTGFVEWNTSQCGFMIRCDKYLMEILSLAMSGDGETTRLDSFEVIGNIHENPSLINP
jgi:uncharacterized phage protein (TIGR01671 family)